MTTANKTIQFGRVPYCLTERGIGDLGLSEALIYLALATFTGKAWRCRPSVATLAGMTGLKPRTIRKVCGRLADKGLIRRRVSRGRGLSNTYEIVTAFNDQKPARQACHISTAKTGEKTGTPETENRHAGDRKPARLACHPTERTERTEARFTLGQKKTANQKTVAAVANRTPEQAIDELRRLAEETRTQARLAAAAEVHHAAK